MNVPDSNSDGLGGRGFDEVISKSAKAAANNTTLPKAIFRLPRNNENQ